MKLQFLIPQYRETDEIIKPLLDSIVIQQNIDFNEIGVIICNDGSDVFLSEEFIRSYPFMIEYHKEAHRGVSATRNACLDYATADYICYCDADDMFFNACGLFLIINEINNGGFDSLVSAFVEETRIPGTDKPIYINHEMDSTFVHGKFHRRKYLIENKIRWNDNLTIHEDSYFNILCQKLSKNVKYCPTPIYLWKWRDDSVCRHDPKYILKTYNNMLDSNTALVEQFISRKLPEFAMLYATSMIYDAYFSMNCDQWQDMNNKEYKDKVEERFKIYYQTFSYLFDAIPKDVKAQIIMGIKNRFFQEGLLLEHITFDDWIKKVMA